MPLSDSALLPWHKTQWAIVASALQRQALPHALLVQGPEGVGKAVFVQQLARSLVCQQREMTQDMVRACGQCTSCRQHAESEAHADIYRLSPEEGERDIKIDAARAAAAFVGLAPHYGGYKLLVINPADKLNGNAANALLKTLEEPPKHTLLILLSARPSLLMPTIRSRCMQIRFSKPQQAEALAWLETQGIAAPQAALDEANGLPLQALRMARDGIHEWRQERDRELAHFIKDRRSASALAYHWQQFDSTELSQWLYDRLRSHLWQQSNATGSASRQAILPAMDAPDTEQVYRLLSEYGKSTYTNINKQLCMVSILDCISGALPARNTLQ